MFIGRLVRWGIGVSLSSLLVVALAAPRAWAVDAVVFGQRDFYGTQTNGGSYPTASTVNNPMFVGVRTGTVQDAQAVSDSDNNRVLIYSAPGANTITSAPTLVLGQVSMTSGAENWPSARPTASSLSHPSQVAVATPYVAVADTNNNRVLIWRTFPTSNLQPADVVVGQADFVSNLPNGGLYTSQRSMNGPRGVAIIGGKLIVSDTQNHRVLIWNAIPTANNAPADVVLGQSSWTSNSANGTVSSGAGANSFYFPWYISTDASTATQLAIADQWNNRVLVWNAVPTSSVGANVVIGQTSFTSQARAFGPSSLNSPRHMIFDSTYMFVADTGANRVLYYPTGPVTGPTATKVFGQVPLTQGWMWQANRQSQPAGNTLNTPTSLLLQGSTLYVSDSQNHRILGYSNAFAAQTGDIFASSMVGQVGPLMGRDAAFPNGKAVDGFGFDRVACMAVTSSYLIVGDMNNSRVLVYSKDNPAAGPISVIGQPDATSHCSFYNPAWTCGAPTASSLNRVTGCAVDAQGRLYISDQQDNRVLVYNSIPTTSGAPADFVLGQDTFTTKTANAGANGGGWLSFPGAIAVTPDNRLLVADGYNYRVLAFALPITANHQLATNAIGHSSLNVAGQEFSNAFTQLSWPRGIYVDPEGRLYLGSGQVWVYDSVPTTNGGLARYMLGAVGAGTGQLGAGTLGSGASEAQQALAALDGYLFVPDQAANRIVAYDRSTLSGSSLALRVLGQTTFNSSVHRPYDTGGVWGGLIDATGLVVDPNGQYVWISEGDGNRVIRVVKSELAKYTYTTGYADDAACLGYDPTVYHAFAYEKWPIRSTLQANGSNVDAQYRPRPVPSLDCLLSRPSSANLKQNILAQVNALPTHSYQIAQYSTWSPAQQQALQAAFATAWNWYENQFAGAGNIPLSDPPTNLLANEAIAQTPTFDENDGTAPTLLTWTDAFNLYLAHVGQSLAIEYGRWLPWTIRDLDSASLRAVLDDSEMYRYSQKTTAAGYSTNYEGFQIAGGGNDMFPAITTGTTQEEGHAIPAPPSVELSYLLDTGVITPVRRRTLGRLIEWGRDNLAHFIGAMSIVTGNDTWQYPGLPPLSRVLNGTASINFPQYGVQHWTAGCHGTSGVFKTLMRSANIPVRFQYTAGHSQLYFPTEVAYFSHSDDPYNQLTKTASFPGETLFIDPSQWYAWYGDVQVNECDFWDEIEGLCEPEYGPNPAALNNIGRRPRELALTYLPGYLMGAYCRDTADGLSHAAGRVAGVYVNDYSVAQLESMGLYTNMDQKLAATPSGCAAFASQYVGP
jgi:sugar lactone lactonase YvrE